MKNGKRSSLWVLKPYMLRYKNLWIGGFISVTVSTAFAVSAPWILKNAINSLNTNVTAEGLLGYGGAIVGVTIMSGILTYFMRQTMIVASRRIEYDFRNDFFAHLMKLDKPFYDKTPTGDIMAKATNDIDAVRNMIGPGIMYFYSTGMTLIFSLTLMMNISVNLTLMSMLPMPIISFLVFLLGRELHKRFAIIQKQYSTITARVQESFSGIRVVKAYVQENAELDDFSKLNKDYMAMNMSMVKIWGMFFPAIVLFSGTAVVMVLWFGGKAVIADKIGLGDFVAFIMYLLMLIWPMAALGWVIGMYQQGKASMVRLEGMLNSQPVVQNNINATNRPIRGKIEFRNLKFSYDKVEVIKGIDAIIDAGTNVAIIGSTGSGKTTLVSLLTLAYPVKRGMLFIDDIDINDYTLESLRSQIAPVMQETFLFSETIKSNISFGNYGQGIESVMNSATAAGISKEIDEFPHKYETIVGERGITLSGGQKQRTALARALAADPKVLILDDAFSSVDTHTEEEILTNIRQILHGRTSFMISHRISTVKDADLILVMSDGKIIERGSHAELLELNGFYKDLYQRQLIKEELEAL